SRDVVEELNGSAAVVRSYAYDISGRQLFARIGANTYYEITNPHGDVVALSSPIALVGTEHFDPWGNAIGSSGTAIPFGFQGGAGSWTDANTGFIYMGARWYYAKAGLFLSSDPAAGTASARAPIDGMRWVYGGNDPLINDDPTGLMLVGAGGGGGGGSAGTGAGIIAGIVRALVPIVHASATGGLGSVLLKALAPYVKALNPSQSSGPPASTAGIFTQLGQAVHFANGTPSKVSTTDASVLRLDGGSS